MSGAHQESTPMTNRAFGPLHGSRHFFFISPQPLSSPNESSLWRANHKNVMADRSTTRRYSSEPGDGVTNLP
ncbi:hypothetical protein TNCV_2859081 [Trichonephila clavipes]|nr:hypothetical protein TNCV_2859081 [Trichonephila clavipes]